MGHEQGENGSVLPLVRWGRNAMNESPNKKRGIYNLFINFRDIQYIEIAQIGSGISGKYCIAHLR